MPEISTDAAPRFFAPRAQVSLAALAAHLGLELLPTQPPTQPHEAAAVPAREGNPTGAPQGDAIIVAASAIGSAAAGHLTFALDAALLRTASDLRGAFTITTPQLAQTVQQLGSAALVSNNPKHAFARALAYLYPSADATRSQFDVYQGSHAALLAQVAEDQTVDISPAALISRGVKVGAGTIIEPGAIIGTNVTIGRGCFIGAAATIQVAIIGNGVRIGGGARIGNTGFGFAPAGGELLQIPHIGRTIIQDNVSLGEVTVINRGTLGDTIIGANTKIDSHVMIGHNVRVGCNCIIVGGSCIAGSATLEDNVTVGGLVGIAEGRNIGAGARLAAMSGITRNVPAGESWTGMPADELRRFVARNRR